MSHSSTQRICRTASRRSSTDWRRRAVSKAVFVAAFLLALALEIPAQANGNWHTLSNGMDAVYVGIGGGAGQVGGTDGIGSWIDGNELRGNHVTPLGEFGYRQVSFFTSECVLGAPPAISLNYPLIVFFEYANRNNNRQDVFTRPSCAAGGLPLGTTSGGALPYGLSPGASASFFLLPVSSATGSPSMAKIMIPNNGLLPTSNGGTATIIAAASADLSIASTGFCWTVQFTWLPSALLSMDHVDGWWFWQVNSIHNNQYWAMSTDELNAYSSNTVAVTGGGTALATFFGSTEYEWHSISRDPTLNTALNPAGFHGGGSYDSATTTAPINPNGGWDVGRHGAVSLSGLGGAINPHTGLGTQNPSATPFGGVPTLGYMSWDNAVPSGLRVVWHQIDWGGVLGIAPDSGLLPDVLVGPSGTRLPISNTSVLMPGPGWPQAATTAQWSLMLHTAVGGHAEPDPLGYPDMFNTQWAITNQLPLAGLSAVCFIGVPVVIDAGSTGVAADLSDFDFGQRMSVSTSITIID